MSCYRELSLELIDFPIDQQTFCDWALTSKHIDSLVKQERSCSRELLAELIDSPIDPQTSWVRELLSELIHSLIEQSMSYDRELLSELTDSPIGQKLLTIRSSYHRSIKSFLRSGALKTPVLGSEALIRAHWLPDRSKTSWDQVLLSELIDSLIDQQTCCGRELLSELIDSPIGQKPRTIKSSYHSSLTLVPTDQKFLAIRRSSYQSLFRPWWSNTRFAIGSFY